MVLGELNKNCKNLTFIVNKKVSNTRRPFFGIQYNVIEYIEKSFIETSLLEQWKKMRLFHELVEDIFWNSWNKVLESSKVDWEYWIPNIIFWFMGPCPFYSKFFILRFGFLIVIKLREVLLSQLFLTLRQNKYDLKYWFNIEHKCMYAYNNHKWAMSIEFINKKSLSS